MKKWLWLFLFVSGYSQEVLTLEKCLEILPKRAIEIGQASLQKEQTQIDEKFYKYNFYPSVRASADVRRNFGTSFDMFTFRRVNRATTFSSPSVSASITLFEGLLKLHTMKQKKNNLRSAEFAYKETYQNLLVNFLQQYTDLFLTDLQIEKTKAQLELLQAQEKKIRNLYEAGNTTKGELLRLRAQIATEEADLVRQTHEKEKKILQIVILLGLNPLNRYEFKSPDIDTTKLFRYKETPETFTTEFVNRSYGVKKAYFEMLAARNAVAIAKSGFYPTLSLTGSIGSNYSSNGGKYVFNPTTGQYEVTRTGYLEQLQDNFFQSFGITLNIPVFNRFERVRSYQQAYIQYSVAELTYRKKRLEALQQAKSLYLDYLSARSNYEAISKQADALKASFEFSKIQFEAGKIDFYTYYKTLTDYRNSLADKQTALYNLQTTLQILEIYTNGVQ